MANYAYPVISLLYLAVPLIAMALAVRAVRRTGRVRPVRMLLRTCSTGAVLGGAVAMLYISVAGARVPPGQIALACYLGIAALCAVAGLNWLLFQGVARLFRLHAPGARGTANRWVQASAGLVQALLLGLIGLPYLGSILFLYRPKARPAGDPMSLIDARFEVVRFRALDSTPLEAWWIPSAHNSRTDGRGSTQWGQDTVLLCHGFGEDKSTDLFLARDLVANGYNVLAIDLRAHGRSGGQFTGFGGIESRDVLGAVRWVKATHPAESRRTLGLGESLGAVALIEAAADPGPEGQAIDAIAAYNPYDELSAVFTHVATEHTIPAGRWALKNVIIPAASAQIGSDLSRVSPGTAVRALWPRPILILGNSTTRRIPGAGSFELYENALQPKYGYWRDDADRETLLHDDTAALTVRIFFDGERSLL